MRPSLHQLASIKEAWLRSISPLQVATTLRLVPLTVIAEYVRLDDLNS